MRTATRVSGEEPVDQDMQSRVAAWPVHTYPIDGLALKSRETLIDMGKTT